MAKKDTGAQYILLPRVENIPKPKEGYKKIKCPICKGDCWITPQAKAFKAKHRKYEPACTNCGLKINAGMTPKQIKEELKKK